MDFSKTFVDNTSSRKLSTISKWQGIKLAKLRVIIVIICLGILNGGGFESIWHKKVLGINNQAIAIDITRIPFEQLNLTQIKQAVVRAVVGFGWENYHKKIYMDNELSRQAKCFVDHMKDKEKYLIPIYCDLTAKGMNAARVPVRANAVDFVQALAKNPPQHFRELAQKNKKFGVDARRSGVSQTEKRTILVLLTWEKPYKSQRKS